MEKTSTKRALELAFGQPSRLLPGVVTCGFAASAHEALLSDSLMLQGRRKP